MAAARIKDLCLDAGDHQALADWWCAVLGYRRADTTDADDAADATDATDADDAADPVRPPRPPGDPVLLLPGPDGGPPLWVNPVPEPKTAKNRLHVDLYGDTAELLAAGAVLLRPDEGNGWDVLADPEGNEFCVFPPPR